MSRYPTFLSPLKVGSFTLRNRAVMGSMHTGMEDKASEYGELAAFLQERAARDGAAMIVTGGVAPNWAGWVSPFSAQLTRRGHVARHELLTKAVHREQGLIVMQILHSGRYGYHPLIVAPSRLKSPITPFTPRALSGAGVHGTIEDFVRCALLARDAGYDGVEVMSSEGYLLSEFLSPRTNKRTDEWGGPFENRMKLPVEIVSQIRAAVGPDFLIVFRLSLLDLVEDGCTWDEVLLLAAAVEKAGASIINSGIGWHEARVPTIATSVPRAAFAWTTAKLKASGKVSIPVIATNRINTPEIAEEILSSGQADLVSMARPFLADAHFVDNARQGKAINICIACNQACLDHTFTKRRSSCLVNPQAGNELRLQYESVAAGEAKRVAIVGGGPAGLAAATVAGERGHKVTLFEASGAIGGQFKLAAQVPGKEEFAHSLDYYEKRLKETQVEVRLHTPATLELLEPFDVIVVATGVAPRFPSDIAGLKECGLAVNYDEVLRGDKVAGQRVAIIGAGGIGFDTATYLANDHRKPGEPQSIEDFNRQWGVTSDGSMRGGVTKPQPDKAQRTIYLLQRKTGKLGAGLSKTTGWIHRTALKNEGVIMIGGVTYKKATPEGLLIEVEGKEQMLNVDTIVICAGQNPVRDLMDRLAHKMVHLVGGAHEAKELDAKAAIREGSVVASKI